jgi:hypothetical protein
MFFLNIFSQPDNDSARNIKYWDIFHSFWLVDYSIQKKPFVELDFGVSNPFLNKNVFKSNFAKMSIFVVKLGYENLKVPKKSTLLQKSISYYLFIQNYNNNLPLSDNINNELNLNAWNVGLSVRKSYIYNMGRSIKLNLYNTDGIGWTLLKFPDKASTIEDQASIDLYAKDLRFGNQTEAGLKFSLSDNIGINAGFERALVYPRFMFWFWAGSEIIYHIGNESINWFVKSVEKSSPEFAPIAYFLIQNAWSNAYYELRKDKMNWPFETVPPLMIESYKFGLSYRF